MKKLMVAALLILPGAQAFAGCYGSSNVYSCNDDSGNTYNVTKTGNSTYLNGYNPSTGSQWSQNSNQIGNSTYTNGTDKDGNSWNQTTTKYGNSTIYSGTDSDGKYYSKTCIQGFDCN